MSKTFDYTDITKGFIFDDGTKVVLPFMRRKRLIFDEYISGPPFVYGGPISISEIKEGHIQELAEYIKTIAEPYKTIIIRGNPYQKTFVFDGFSKVNDHSHILDLTGFASEADYMQKKNYHYKEYMRIWRKAKLEVKKEVDAGDYETFYKIYRKLRSTWNVQLTNHPISLYKNIAAMDSPGRTLWSVYLGNTMIGAEVNFVYNKKCCAFLAAFDKEYSKFEPRRFLLHHIIVSCIESGISFYDLLTSGGLTSLEQFKLSVGGREYPHVAWLRENPVLVNLRQIKKRMIGSLNHS